MSALAADGTRRRSRFAPGASPYALGETPLPPYIRRERAARRGRRALPDGVRARAGRGGRADRGPPPHARAARRARARAASRFAEVVLHVGPGTFRPLARGGPRGGPPPRRALRAARGDGRGDRRDARRAAGAWSRSAPPPRACSRRARATTARVAAGRAARPSSSLRPGRRFRVVDALLTNFHLPRSSLLLLVAAFAGRETVLDAYAKPSRAGYRFYSYGDAMLIL